MLNENGQCQWCKPEGCQKPKYHADEAVRAFIVERNKLLQKIRDDITWAMAECGCSQSGTPCSPCLTLGALESDEDAALNVIDRILNGSPME